MTHVFPGDDIATLELEVSAPDGAVERRVETLLSVLHKAFSAVRMYTPDHPAVYDSVQRLSEGFEDFFDVEEEMRIELSESEIAFHGKTVYREAKTRGSLLFMLFNDGVRTLQFENGLTREEITEFLEALRTNVALPQEERDIVSLFWARGFDHIHYFAVEEIPDQENKSVDRALAELETQEEPLDRTGVTEKSDERQPWIQYLREEGGASEPPSDIPVLAQLKAYKQEEIEGLLETLSRGRGFDAEGELVQIILDILLLEEDLDRSLPVLTLIEELLNELLARCDFVSVNRLITGLRHILEEAPSGPLGQHAEAMLRRFSGGEMLDPLRLGLRGECSYEPTDLYTFVTLLQPTGISPICSVLEEMTESQARGAICEGLEFLARGQTSRLARPLAVASERVGRDIVAVLGEIGDEDALTILATCTTHPDSGIRREAVMALRTVGTQEAQKTLTEFLSDQDAPVRTAAAEGLAASNTCCDIMPLMEIVHQRSFIRRSFREKRALLSVLGRVGSEQSLQVLETLLRKKSVLHRKRCDETRICAALALGGARSVRACRLLERFCRDSSPGVRRACDQAVLSARMQLRRVEHDQ